MAAKVKRTTSEILTLDEAALFLRVEAAELLALASKGVVPAQKIGADWRFLKSALKDWLYLGHVWTERAFEVMHRLLPEATNGTPTESRRESAKQRMLRMAGSWKDDPSVDQLLKSIYELRGRPMVEEPG